MLTHYIKIAFRNMRKHKIQNIVGIIGLAISFAFFALGYNWMEYETSYDGFYPDSKHIYRIYGIEKQTGRTLDQLPSILSEKLNQEFPEVEKVAMIYPRYGSSIKWEEKVLGNVDFRFVDEYFFEIFPQNIICGKTDHLFYTPEEAVITEKFSRKYWASPEDALGKTLKDGYGQTLTIVAVIENPPANSNFQLDGYRTDIMGRKFSQQNALDKQWSVMMNQIFILLNENTDIATFQQKIQNYAIDNKFNENLVLKAVNIADMRHTMGTNLSFNITYIYTFAGAGLLLLFCSIFNFLNLYINRMLQRAREIKLRKTVGGYNHNIINQLQTELAIQLILICIVGILLLKLAIPIFEQRFETQIININLWKQFLLIAIIGFAIIFIACLLAEIKFIHFSSLSQTYSKYTNRLFRNISICIQLAICILFLMSAFIFRQQVSFMDNFGWGFKKEGLIQMTMHHRDRKSITENIKQLALVNEFIPTGLFNISNEPHVMAGEIKWVEKPEGFNPIIEVYDVGRNFNKGFEIPIVKGRFFEEEDIISEETPRGISLKSNKIVVNQGMEKLMGKENIIGETIEIPTGAIYSSGAAEMETMEVIGVINDFHTLTLQKPVYPLILRCVNSEFWGYYNYVRVKDGTEEQAIAAITEVFKKFASPGDPEEVDLITMPQLLDDLSKSEKASLQLFAVLAVLCIIIAIFGIYSISSSNIERRKKEIAVRKVCGATATNIVGMFVAEYSKLLLFANLIALPPALFFMSRWLEQYAYHIDIHIWMVLLIIAFTFVLVISTIFAQVIDAANQNPAEVVKAE